LISLAQALDVDLSELVGKRPRLVQDEDARVLPLRDLVLSPDLLPDVDMAFDGEPRAPEHLGAAINEAWAAYWAGAFSRLAVVLPGLVREARTSRDVVGPRAAPMLAQAYQLVACLLVHMGKDDLAALGAERAIHAAERGDDELQWATLHGTYAWALLHQGRTDASEDHALRIASRIEPSITGATLPHLTVWGGLVLTAMAAAVAGGRGDAAKDYIGLARSAAGRFVSDRHDYQVNFGQTQVAMQATHAHAVLREPAQAIRASDSVRREDLFTISYGRHLIDVAQAQVDARDMKGAEATLLRAEGMSSEWFRHQGPARSLVGELVQEARRLSPPLRRLAKSTGVDN